IGLGGEGWGDPKPHAPKTLTPTNQHHPTPPPTPNLPPSTPHKKAQSGGDRLLVDFRYPESKEGIGGFGELCFTGNEIGLPNAAFATRELQHSHRHLDPAGGRGIPACREREIALDVGVHLAKLLELARTVEVDVPTIGRRDDVDVPPENAI